VEILEKEFSGDTGAPSRLSQVDLKLLVVGKGKSPFITSRDYVFAGPMSDVENAYAAADLFIFLPIYEPSANVVVEALAAGLPVITSAQNGASELIQEGINGSVLPDPSDIDAVVESIAFWSSQRFMARPADTDPLRLERNVAETVKVLELAASERRAAS
jgi:UDP-glucose:(heptosyl)LPS alpha-1,3-glucosyltransferase